MASGSVTPGDCRGNGPGPAAGHAGGRVNDQTGDVPDGPGSGAASAGPPIRIGYSRTSAIRQELARQLDALHAASCTRVFPEQISSRVKVRPELDKALALAREINRRAGAHLAGRRQCQPSLLR